MKKGSLIALLLIVHSLSAQPTAHLSTLKGYETALRPLAKELLKAPTDAQRTTANKNFIKLFEEALQLKESYTYNFDSIINLKVLTADDKKLRIYSWTVPPAEENNYEYYGYVQLLQKRGGFLGFFSREYSITTIKLRDATKEIPDPQNTKLKSERWFGAWYYQLITSRYLGKPYYTLVGWKGKDRLTTMKVIDNISISDDGKVSFGLPIFKDDKLTKCREIFEFSAGVSMSLHYGADKKISVYEINTKTKKKKLMEYKNVIVFDHIVAPEGKLGGQQQFSRTDLSLDAYYFKKGKWLMLHNVNDQPAPPPPSARREAKSLYSPPKRK